MDEKQATLLLSAIGALAWLPTIISFLKEPKLEGKILGYTHGDCKFSNQLATEIAGIGYYPKLAVTSINKDFNVKKIEVCVRYSGDSKTYKGKLFWANTIDLGVLNGKKKFLKIPEIEHCSHLLTIRENNVHVFFAPFIIEKNTLEFPSQIIFYFYDFEEKMLPIVFNMDKVDFDNTTYEEKYFVDYF